MQLCEKNNDLVVVKNQSLNTITIYLYKHISECHTDVIDDIAGDEGLVTQFFGRQVAGKSVGVYAEDSRFKRRITLRQQPGEQPGERVAAAAGGHAGVAGGVEKAGAVRTGDAGVRAF